MWIDDSVCTTLARINGDRVEGRRRHLIRRPKSHTLEIETGEAIVY